MRLVTDDGRLESVREDAAHFPGGHASALVVVETEADVASAFALARPLLPIGAQSSLTGGATPRGDIVVSTARLTTVSVRSREVDAGAGVPLETLQHALAARGLLYPPVPTFAGAFVGGSVATNAAGAATFKYGTTRDWVAGLTIVLASGEVLDLHRGEVTAHPDGYFDIQGTAAAVRVPIVPLSLPGVPKCSAGYALAREMDLVDLFIGAEGTLGIITSVTLKVLADPPAAVLAMVALATEEEAVSLAARLRSEAHRTWREGDGRGIDISAIEHADRRSLELVRAHDAGRTLGNVLPDDAGAVVFVGLDLPTGTPGPEAWHMIETALEPDAGDTPLGRFCRLLAEQGLLERTEVALPGDESRRRQLLAVREAIPSAVNHRVALAQQTVSPDISKLAGDFIVPFEAFRSMEQACRDACAARGLDLAIWGHISDGNIHPNVIPRDLGDVARGREALREAGQAVIALGGSPLAEHGVGRNPLKQEFLELLHGPDGVAAMRAVKRALDPHGLLAPGVLLPAGP